jgi:hypothetical protein
MYTSLRWTILVNFSVQRRAESRGLNPLTATYFFPIPQIENNEDSTPSTGTRRRSVQDQRDLCRRRGVAARTYESFSEVRGSSVARRQLLANHFRSLSELLHSDAVFERGVVAEQFGDSLNSPHSGDYPGSSHSHQRRCMGDRGLERHFSLFDD